VNISVKMSIPVKMSILLIKDAPAAIEVDAAIANELVKSGLTEHDLEEAKTAAIMADAKMMAELKDAEIAAKLAKSEMDETSEIDSNVADIEAAALAADIDAIEAATKAAASKATSPKKTAKANASKIDKADTTGKDTAVKSDIAGKANAEIAALTEKQSTKLNSLLDKIKIDQAFIEEAISLDKSKFTAPFVSKIDGIFTEIISQLNHCLEFSTYSQVLIKITPELLQFISLANEFDIMLQMYYSVEESLLPGTGKSLVVFLTSGVDIIKMVIDYDSFFSKISFGETTIQKYIEDCKTNSTLTLNGRPGSKLSPRAAKAKFDHLAESQIFTIVKNIASFIRGNIGAACDDIFTTAITLMLKDAIVEVYGLECVNLPFSKLSITNIVEAVSIEYATKRSTESANVANKESGASFVHIARIARSMSGSSHDGSSHNDSPRDTTLRDTSLSDTAPHDTSMRDKAPHDKVELYNDHYTYGGNVLCGCCDSRTASTNRNPDNGPIGDPLFAVHDDDNQVVAAVCQTCAYCLVNRNKWTAEVHMSYILIKTFKAFDKETKFKGKKNAIAKLRKAHLNCNKCNAVNARVFNPATNALVFGAYCIRCVSNVYQDINGHYPNSKYQPNNDFSLNQQEYLRRLSMRA